MSYACSVTSKLYYVALAVIDNAGSYQYATVNGLGVEDESFSINKTKTNPATRLG
jgi:hypothetical protein